MSQISPPIRILLIAVIGFMAAYMLVLKPKDEPATAPAPVTAPGVTGLTNAVDQAKDAAAAQESRDAQVQQATGGGEAAAPGAAPADAARTEAVLATGRVLTLAPLEGEQTKDLPAGIRKALAKRQVFAVGVFNSRSKRWSRMPADDRRVRRALDDANRYGGKVTVHSATLNDLSKLRPVIGGAQVAQSPSVVVVDRNRQATVLEGYVDRISINQAIADARRNSIAFRIKDPYVRRLNETCANFDIRGSRFNLVTTPSGTPRLRPTARRASRLLATYRAAFGRLAAPARWRPMQRQIAAVMRRREQIVAAANGGSLAQVLQAAVVHDRAAAGLDRRFAQAGATTCVSNRRS